MAGGYDTLQAMLQGRPIVFHPMLARAFGGINEALLFQQLAFWSDKGRNPEWIYKTQRELQNETCLTRTQQESARRSLRTLGVVEEKKQGLPAKLYFRVVWPKVFAVLDEYSMDQNAGNPQPRMQRPGKDAGILQARMRDVDIADRGEPADRIAANQQSLTRNTEKTAKRRTEMSTFRQVEESTNQVDGNNGIDGTTELTLTQVLAQIATKLSDESDLNRSYGRLEKLYSNAKVDLDTFITRMDGAVARTLRATVEERTEQGRPARMRYFFTVLEDLLGLRKEPGLRALPPGEEPMTLPVQRGSRVHPRIRSEVRRRPGATG